MDEQPQYASQIAKSSVIWPMNLQARTVERNKQLKSLDKLGFGELFPPRGRGKAPDYDSFSTRLAQRILGYVLSVKSTHLPDTPVFPKDEIYPISFSLVQRIWNLPELSMRNSSKWIDVCWKVLWETTDGKPEQDIELRRLGESRRSEHEVSYGDGASETTLVNKIREGIKYRVIGSLKIVLADHLRID